MKGMIEGNVIKTCVMEGVYWAGCIRVYNKSVLRVYKDLEPKWPLLWLEFRPCFGGLTFKNRGQLGSSGMSVGWQSSAVSSFTNRPHGNNEARGEKTIRVAGLTNVPRKHARKEGHKLPTSTGWPDFWTINSMKKSPILASPWLHSQVPALRLSGRGVIIVAAFRGIQDSSNKQVLLGCPVGS